VQGTAKFELAAELERTARLCEDAAALYVERHGDAVGADVVTGLLLVAAALDTAVDAVESDTALLITATLARDAVDAAERRGLDEALLGCVTALRRVTALCEEATVH
jgi:phosphohistidine swiveling domain-containing protein